MKILLSSKRLLVIFLTIAILFVINTKNSAATLSVFDSSWIMLASEDVISKTGHVGPGNGGQDFDAEYLFYKLEGSKLSLGLQTGFDVMDGHIYYQGHDYYAGDLALSFNMSPSSYEYAVDFGLYTRDFVGDEVGPSGLHSAGLYNVNLWNNDVEAPYEISSPFAMENGVLINGLIDNYAGSGFNPRTEDLTQYFGGPKSYFRVVSFDASQLSIGSLSAKWTESCGNDNIAGYVKGAEVPEPGTMFLLGSLATGLFGFAGLRRRFLN